MVDNDQRRPTYVFHFLLAFFSRASGPKLSNLPRNFIPNLLRVFAFQSLMSISPKVYQSFLFLIRPFVVLLFICLSRIFYRRFHSQRIADASDGRVTRAIRAIAGS